MTFLWCFLLVFGGVVIGGGAVALCAIGARTDLALDASYQRARADLAHCVGDQMADFLASLSERKDLSRETRHSVTSLLARWAELALPAYVPTAAQSGVGPLSWAPSATVEVVECCGSLGTETVNGPGPRAAA